jgi:5-bromo-4-chloroindolyl phosphate hydrolysis protein
MRKIRVKSAVPVYGFAAVWLLYCLFFPLYRLWHFAVVICVAAAVSFILSRIFPGRTEFVEEPVVTGNPEVDTLLREGERAVGELSRLRKTIGEESVCKKVDEIIDVTDKIFKDAAEDPADVRRIRRFADYYIPTTIKLLNEYDRLGRTGYEGEQISGTKKRIESILDTMVSAYKKQLDALFSNQALDIETDIVVLENMLKREGLADSDLKGGGETRPGSL